MSERIARYLATRNVYSRRQAERLIVQGQVCVNGTLISSPVIFVDDSDTITVGQRKIVADQTTRLWLYYKPRGEITTHNDPQHRRTVFETLEKKGLPRVISVGRLDLNSEGLLLLTTNSALAHNLEKPNQNLTRTYRVRAFGAVRPAIFQRFLPNFSPCKTVFNFPSVTLERIHYAPFTFEFDQPFKELMQRPAHNFWCTLTLSEGKNREIRRILQVLNLQVNRLIRLRYGPFQLGTLQPGDLLEIKNISKRLSEITNDRNM